MWSQDSDASAIRCDPSTPEPPASILSLSLRVSVPGVGMLLSQNAPVLCEGAVLGRRPAQNTFIDDGRIDRCFKAPCVLRSKAVLRRVRAFIRNARFSWETGELVRRERACIPAELACRPAPGGQARC